MNPPKLKLSQAIRLGCQISSPTQRHFIQADPTGHLYACALGAAYLGTGKTYSPGRSGEAMNYLTIAFPELDYSPDGPENLRGTTYWSRLVIWNDYEGLTREQIADILEDRGL